MATDWKKYWQELAAKKGIPAEKVQAIAEVLGDEAVAGAFSEGFKTLPDYSRDLDKVRDEWKPKAEKADQWEKWYNEQGKPAYETNLAGIKALQKYQELYGALPEGDVAPSPKPNGQVSNGLTKEELTKALQEQAASFVALTKQATRISAQHLSEWKEPLDFDQLEKFAVEGRYADLNQAYKDFIEPRRTERQQKEFDDKLKQRYEEGLREGRSRAEVPGSGGGEPSEPHPFFDRKQPAEKLSPSQAEEAARASFVQLWNESSGSVAQK